MCREEKKKKKKKKKKRKRNNEVKAKWCTVRARTGQTFFGIIR